MTKDFFINNEYLHHELLKKVVRPFFDTGYTDESGLKELVEAAQGVIVDMQITSERDMMQRLFKEIRKEDGGLSAYGEDMVRKCAEMGAVDTFLISSKLKKYRIKAVCPNGHETMMTVDDPDAPVKCPECGFGAKVAESKDLIDDFFEMSELYNSSIQLISGDSEEGEMLYRAFGGIAALLRYKVG